MNNLYNRIVEGSEKVSLIGLGYVGLPIAVAFDKKVKVLGFDLNESKVEAYRNGIDVTNEVGNQAVIDSNIEFSTNPSDLESALFHIVAVPTPTNEDKTPDLNPVIGASRMLGKHLKKGSVVVYESTVYPGVTEEICIPILEEESNLKCGVDFKVGYSPERINPGDQQHRLENIVKVVSGMDEESLECIAKVYELVIEAGVHRASSIKVAEAAKVIENSQRDINIAFVNELSIIFNLMDIDTQEVLEAAGTKWNFLAFKPGLVGGHCIGVDPYYLTHKAQELGYNSQVILAGRRINDSMGSYIVSNVIKKMSKAKIELSTSKVGIMGFTFKEDCPDTRNTKVVDIVNELNDYGIKPVIYDPVADKEEALHEYGLSFDNKEDLNNLDVLIVAVSHEEFVNMESKEYFNMLKNDGAKIVIDIKSILDKKEFIANNMNLWRL